MAEQQRLRVFIIDDDGMMRAALRIIIQGDEYDVIGDASSGKSGLEQIRRLRPDMICLDVKMPDSNGLDLLEQIHQALPESVVLMVTASNDKETVITALQRGANGFIIKPFNSGTVLDALDNSVAKLLAKRARQAS